MMSSIVAPSEARFRYRIAGGASIDSVAGDPGPLLGYDAESFLSRQVDLLERVHAEDRKLLRALFDIDTATAPQAVKLRVRQASGRIRCFEARYRVDCLDGQAFLDLTLNDVCDLPRSQAGFAATPGLQTIVDSSADYACIKDLNHVYGGASASLTALCDAARRANGLIGLTDYDVFPESYADACYRLEEQVLGGLPAAHEEVRLPRGNGCTDSAEHFRYPICDATGAVIGVYGIARNAGNPAQLPVLQAIAGFLSRQHDGRFLEALTEFAARLFAGDCVHLALLEPGRESVRVLAGFQAGQPVAPGRVYALSGTPGERVLQNDQSCYPSGVQALFPGDRELAELAAEGYSGATLTDDRGQAIGLLAMTSSRPIGDAQSVVAGLRILAARAGTDLLTRRNEETLRRETSLRASESRFRALFEQVQNIAVQGYDAARQVIYWNAASEALYGYSRAEALGRQLEDLIIPDFMRQGVIDASTAWLQGGAAIPAGELTLRRKDNSPVAVFSSHVMLTNSHGEAEMYCVDIELTELKKTEAELRAYQTRLEAMVDARTAELAAARDTAEAASRAKSTFLANMSHELRTPMNSIMGMLELARRRMTDERGLDQIDKARWAADHLLGVLNNVLDISKIEAERMLLEDAPLQLASIFTSVVSMLGQKASDKGLLLQANIAEELAGMTLKGDSLRLGQILFNLTGNAIKFTDQGSIGLSAQLLEETPAGVQLRFAVSDTGIGIDAKAQDRLFQSFEQADNSMTRKYGGTGLGLAISKRLVQLMGGEIGVHSAPGAGSTFWFTVRLQRCAADAVAPAPTIARLPANRRLREEHAGKRVLLTDDEPLSQEISRGLLEDVGLVVDVADDGLRAWALAKRSSYALILMDMQMPNLNGVDATQAIRSDSLNRSTPILAMTANAFDDDREICLAAGMNDHIAKPVYPDTLYDTLLRWLSQANQRTTDDADERSPPA